MRLPRKEMLRYAAEEYETVRGTGSWFKDNAQQTWNSDAYEYLSEIEVRMRSRMLAQLHQRQLKETRFPNDFRSTTLLGYIDQSAPCITPWNQ